MNSEQQEQQQPDVERVSLGTGLKTAREQLGLSLKDVADRLRLKVSVIEEIEQERFDADQIPAYTRGYIRAYAKFVGLNPDSLLQASNLDIARAPTAPMQSFSRKTRKQKNDNRLMTLTWAILSIFVGITIIWWWQSNEEEILTTPPLVEVSNERVEPQVPITEPIVELPVSSVSVASIEEESTISKAIDIASTEAQVPTPEPKKAEPPSPKINAPVIAMNFIADCWVDIRDGNDKRLLTGIKSRGESVTLDGKEPFKIVLGAPSAVELTYRGQKIDLSAFPPKRVARLSLPQN